ncbi:hypothetical protein PIB30_049962 [Stylosanthes scabra]|uniref:Uncharacterized protein n=1 Tax=Stylosanthes scabra TaxID=79078 RepID=A0ABU6WJ47_9FABA|nr:hypothetical protein [Stylosanthes scabra]
MSSSTEVDENKKKKQESFNAETASLIVKNLAATFASGKTRTYEWRASQLKALTKLFSDAHQQQIVDALYSDLAKPPLETVAYEIAMLKNSCKGALKELKRWMTSEKSSLHGTIRFCCHLNHSSELLQLVMSWF